MSVSMQTISLDVSDDRPLLCWWSNEGLTDLDMKKVAENDFDVFTKASSVSFTLKSETLRELQPSDAHSEPELGL